MRETVFAGARTRARTLVEHLEAEHPLDRCPDDYPGVAREHGIAVPGLAKRAPTTPAA